MFCKELRNGVERNEISTVIKICMIGAEDNHQLLVITRKFSERILTEITGMCLLIVNQRIDRTPVIAPRRIGELQFA